MTMPHHFSGVASRIIHDLLSKKLQPVVGDLAFFFQHVQYLVNDCILPHRYLLLPLLPRSGVIRDGLQAIHFNGKHAAVSENRAGNFTLAQSLIKGGSHYLWLKSRIRDERGIKVYILRLLYLLSESA